MNNFFEKRYSIRLVWLIIIALAIIFAGTFVIFKFFLEWRTKDSIDYTSKFTLCILAFITLIYHFHNLENQIRTQINSNKQNLAKYTYDICADFRKPMMKDINEDLRCILEKYKDDLKLNNIQNFIKFIDDPTNRESRQALVITLNYFESVAAMTLVGDLDDEIVKRHFGKLFGRYYLRLQHYISHRQEESSSSWVNFESLAKKWIKEFKQ